MKKLTILSFVASFMLFGFSAIAQTQGEIRAGLGLALGTEAAIDDDGSSKIGLGINIGGEYLVTDVIGVAPSYTTFFESSVGTGTSEISVKLSSFNIDGRYYFLTDDLQVYGLFGISIASSKTTTPVIFGFGGEFSDSETGINIGGGVNLPFGDNLLGNAQAKYNTPLEQLVLQFGVSYIFNN